MTCCMEDNTE